MGDHDRARRSARWRWAGITVVVFAAVLAATGCGQASDIEVGKHTDSEPFTDDDDDPEVSAFILWPPEEPEDEADAAEDDTATAEDDTEATNDGPPDDDADVAPSDDDADVAPSDEDADTDDDQPDTGSPSTDDPAPDLPREVPATPSGPLDGIVIALDPGHNGGNFDHPEIISRPVDAGGFTKPCNTTGTATQQGVRESTFNLELALRLAGVLGQRGAEVHLTRVDDAGVGPCIDLRGRFGTAVGADVYLSIHADGASPSARGFHLIRPSGRPGTDLNIVEPSAALATVIRDHLVAAGFSVADYTGVQGIVARDDLATLNLSSVPVLLLEAGNMRNPDDAAMLLDAAAQQRMAEALADALQRFTTP